MCIAIYSPRKAENIDLATFRRCATQNSDGMGLMWVEDGTIETYKTLCADPQLEKTEFEADVQKFWLVYQSLRDYGKDVVIHFRYMTHGRVCLANTHPFFLDEDRTVGFVHNGILSVPSTTEVSDSRMFGYHFLRFLKDGWRDDAICRAVVEEAMGYSKIIMMDVEGRVDILNESAGVWDKGVWYSNDGYKGKRSWGYNSGYTKNKNRRGSYSGYAFNEGGWEDDERFRSGSSSGTNVIGTSSNTHADLNQLRLEAASESTDPREFMGIKTASQAQEARSAGTTGQGEGVRSEVKLLTTGDIIKADENIRYLTDSEYPAYWMRLGASYQVLACSDCAGRHRPDLQDGELLGLSMDELYEIGMTGNAMCEFCSSEFDEEFIDHELRLEKAELAAKELDAVRQSMGELDEAEDTDSAYRTPDEFFTLNGINIDELTDEERSALTIELATATDEEVRRFVKVKHDLVVSRMRKRDAEEKAAAAEASNDEEQARLDRWMQDNASRNAQRAACDPCRMPDTAYEPEFTH